MYKETKKTFALGGIKHNAYKDIEGFTIEIPSGTGGTTFIYFDDNGDFERKETMPHVEFVKK